MLSHISRKARQTSQGVFDALMFRQSKIPRRLPLYDFKDQANVQNLLVGSDRDIGGLSEATLGFNEDPESPAAVFSGHVSTQVPAECIYISTGYVGLKTRRLGTSFTGGPLCHDLSQFAFLEVKARDLSSYTPPLAAQDTKVSSSPLPLHAQISNSRLQFFLNIKATTYAELDLYQFPLKFESSDWHTFVVPFRHFILTHKGLVLETQRTLPRENVESFGISLVKQEGPFHLEIASIHATNPIGESDEEVELALELARGKGDEEAVAALEKKRAPLKF